MKEIRGPPVQTAVVLTYEKLNLTVSILDNLKSKQTECQKNSKIIEKNIFKDDFLVRSPRTKKSSK